MCTQNTLQSITNQIKQCYQEVFGDDIVEIILYGSYARGDFTINSDVDIVAIVRGDRLELQNKLKWVWDKAAEIGVENDVIVSPTVIPYEEFEAYRNSLPYYRNIASEGIRIE